jgi:hypothetical protein
MARLRFNRLLSQFLEGIISLFFMRRLGRITFWQFCRSRWPPLWRLFAAFDFFASARAVLSRLLA